MFYLKNNCSLRKKKYFLINNIKYSVLFSIIIFVKPLQYNKQFGKF